MINYGTVFCEEWELRHSIGVSGGELDIGLVDNLPFLSRSRTVMVMKIFWPVAVLTMGRKSLCATAKVTPQTFETE